MGSAFRRPSRRRKPRRGDYVKRRRRTKRRRSAERQSSRRNSGGRRKRGRPGRRGLRKLWPAPEERERPHLRPKRRRSRNPENQIPSQTSQPPSLDTNVDPTNPDLIGDI